MKFFKKRTLFVLWAGFLSGIFLQTALALAPQVSLSDLIATLHYKKSPNILSFDDYIGMALYNPKFGYYSTGQVQIKTDGSDSFHFSTEVGEIAIPIAEAGFRLWEEMIDKREIGPEEPFMIYEFGAGFGDMALQMLRYIRGRGLLASQDGTCERWKNFYKNLRYVIGEISPALIEKQKEKLRPYEDKAQFFCLSASDGCGGIPKGHGLVVSNELFDAMNFSKVKMTYSRATKDISLSVAVVAPTIPKALLEKDKSFEISANALVPRALADQVQKDGRVFISRSGAEEFLSSKQKRDAVVFVEWFEPLSSFSEDYAQKITALMTAKKEVATALFEQSGRQEALFYPILGIDSFFKGVASFLQKGVVLTFDYGHSRVSEAVRAMDKPFMLRGPTKLVRIYGDEDKISEKNPLRYCGQIDITTDVSVDDLMDAGQKHGFLPIFLGAQYLWGTDPTFDFFSLVQAKQTDAKQWIKDLPGLKDATEWRRSAPYDFKNNPVFTWEDDLEKKWNNVEGLRALTTFIKKHLDALIAQGAVDKSLFEQEFLEKNILNPLWSWIDVLKINDTILNNRLQNFSDEQKVLCHHMMFRCVYYKKTPDNVKQNYMRLMDVLETWKPDLKRHREEWLGHRTQELFRRKVLDVARLQELSWECGSLKKMLETYKEEGNTLYQGEEYAEALAFYKEALDLYRLVQDKAKMGEKQKEEINKMLAVLNNNMGLCLKQQNRFDEAIKKFEESLRLNPEYKKASNNIADIKKKNASAYA